MIVKWRGVAILTLKWSLCNSQRLGEISDRAVRGSPVGNQILNLSSPFVFTLFTIMVISIMASNTGCSFVSGVI